MKREIKFRGISKETGDFVYGGYGVLGKDTDIEKHIIVVSILDNHPNTQRFYFTDVEVEKESVGQFTGLTDKNGKEIYEGDIMKMPFDTGIAYVINDGFMYCVKSPGSEAVDYETSDVFEASEVLGNIHENPELLCNEKKE